MQTPRRPCQNELSYVLGVERGAELNFGQDFQPPIYPAHNTDGSHRARNEHNFTKKKKKNKTKKEELQRKTGIRNEPCPLRGVEVDPHLQCFPDFDHFFDLGICMRLFSFVCGAISKQEQAAVEVRLRGIEMPRGWNKFSLHLRSVSKKMKPMTYIRKLCLLGVYLFKDIVNSDLHTLMVKLLHLRGKLLQPFQTDESIAKVFIYLILLTSSL